MFNLLITFIAFLSLLVSVGMATQFGGGRMGGVALPASGETVQNFTNMPRGPIDSLLLTIKVTGKSSAGAFNFAVSTGSAAAAEGSDDIDKLLAALFTNMSLFWEQDNFAFTAMSLPQIRTVLGGLNKRDFVGTLVNGLACQATGGANTAYTIDIMIPVSLRRYMPVGDGVIFTSGSQRLKNGELRYNVASLTPSAVLTNGTFVVSALSVDLNAIHGAGSDGDIGPTWRASRISGIQTVYDFPAATGGRLGLWDVTPAGTSTITNITIGDNSLITPDLAAAKYQAGKLTVGGYDISARCTPYIYLPDDFRFADMATMANRPVHMEVFGVASMTVYDIQSIGASAEASLRVHTQVGGGGGTSVQLPSPPSLPVGSRISPVLSHLAPKRVKPGGAPGLVVQSPAAGARQVQARKVNALVARKRR